MKTYVADLAFISLFLGAVSVHSQTSAFTYQAHLADQGQPANGSYDLNFVLLDAPAGGSSIGVTNVVNDLSISNGVFTVMLDFGAEAFDGSGRWLEVAVRPGASTGAYTNLVPRQFISPSPYAIYAGAVNAAGIVGAIPASKLTGKLAEAQLPSNVALLAPSNTAQQATGGAILTGQFITGASVTFGGSGYTSAPPVTVVAPIGSGAVILSTISNGSVVALTVTNAGSGYTSGATLNIAPPPNNAFQTFGGTNFFTGVSTFTGPGNSFNGRFGGNGSGLTNLEANALIGTVSDATLSTNVALRVGGNAFSGVQSIAGDVGIGTTLPQSKLHIVGGDLLSGAAGEEWLFHTRYQAGGDFLQITDRDGGVPQFQRGLVLNQFGNVGIGTTAPGAKLDIRGDVRLGPSGQYFATAGSENLRIVRGIINAAGGIITGSGFTVSHTAGSGIYTVNFTSAFAGTPSIALTCEHDPGTFRSAETDGVTTTWAVVSIWTPLNLATTVDAPFHFIAIGPR